MAAEMDPYFVDLIKKLPHVLELINRYTPRVKDMYKEYALNTGVTDTGVTVELYDFCGPAEEAVNSNYVIGPYIEPEVKLPDFDANPGREFAAYLKKLPQDSDGRKLVESVTQSFINFCEVGKKRCPHLSRVLAMGELCEAYEQDCREGTNTAMFKASCTLAFGFVGEISVARAFGHYYGVFLGAPFGSYMGTKLGEHFANHEAVPNTMNSVGYRFPSKMMLNAEQLAEVIIKAKEKKDRKDIWDGADPVAPDDVSGDTVDGDTTWFATVVGNKNEKHKLKLVTPASLGRFMILTETKLT